MLNIHPMLVSLAFEQAEQIGGLLNQVQPDITAGAAPDWRKIWNCLQPGSTSMWAFDGCTVGGRNYIRHIVASTCLSANQQ